MLLLNLNGSDPIFVQIKAQVIRYMQLGVIKPGEKLPSVRMLAQDLGINPNTVARAYMELEEEGYIYTMNKKGVFAAERNGEQELRNAGIRRALVQIKEQGIEKEELLKMVEDIYSKGE